MPELINVLVHGLFFMRLSDDVQGLDLVAPKLPAPSYDHKFVGGVRAKIQPFAPLPTSTNWRSIGLTGKAAPQLKRGEMPSDLKPSNLQLSLTGATLKGWNKDNFYGLISLPWPLNFFSVRCDFFDRVFLYDPKKPKMGDHIKGKCRKTANSKIGIITCLQYEYSDRINIPGWVPDTNLHCYYEPCEKPEDVPHVNLDLKAAARCFQTPDNFDLQMLSTTGGLYTERGERCPDKVPKLDVNDDYCLSEDPLASKNICNKLASAGKDSAHKDSRFDVSVLNVHPANCPNFFVGP